MAAGGPCLNCGTERVGPFCHACGQESVDPEAGAVRLFVESAQDALSLDHRVVRTLRLLVARPGALAEAWAAGRRVSFVTPVRLFLVLGALLVGLGLLESAVTPDPEAAATEEPASAEETDRTEATTLNVAYWLGFGMGRLGVYAFLVFVPVVGVAYWVLYRARYRSLAPHLVHALHLAAACVVAVVLWKSVRIAWLLGWPHRVDETLGVQNGEVLIAIGMACITAYTALSVRRFYRSSWVLSASAAVLVVAVPFALIMATVLALFLVLSAL